MCYYIIILGGIVKYKYLLVILIFNLFYVGFSILDPLESVNWIIPYVLFNPVILSIYFLLFGKNIKAHEYLKIDLNLVIIILQVFFTTLLVFKFNPLMILIIALGLMMFFIQYYYASRDLIRNGKDIFEVMIVLGELTFGILFFMLLDFLVPYFNLIIFSLFIICFVMILNIYNKQKNLQKQRVENQVMTYNTYE